MSIVSVRDLTVQMGGRTILRDVNLDLRPREALAVIGPNGAGKSTLLKAIMGMVPHRGRVALDRRPLSELSPRQVGRIIALVPQPSEGRPPVTPLELAILSRYPWQGSFDGVGCQEMALIRSALEAVDLWELRDVPMGCLSGGEAQRALIAAALAQDTRCLVLDEPTAFLDYRHQCEVLRLLLDLRSRGEDRGMIMATHDVNLALRWATRVVALRGGRVVLDRSPEDLGPEELSSVFQVRFRRISDPQGGCIMPQELML